jgi:hypothetical protein
MDVGVGCTAPTYNDFADGVERERIPYDPEYESDSCHDCAVSPGQLHHPGCDMEICPGCGGQSLGCGCSVGEDDSPEPESDPPRVYPLPSVEF